MLRCSTSEGQHNAQFGKPRKGQEKINYFFILQSAH